MTRVDQFESVFRAAAKAVYRHEEIEVRKVLVVTDLDGDRAQELGERVRTFLGVLRDRSGEPQWRVVRGTEFRGVGELLALVDGERPDLVCTYRHLHSDGWKWPNGLGEELEVLTQATPYPILVVPHPEAGRAFEHALVDTDTVMAVTDHLTGDHRLVNHALRFTARGGTLFLTHIEDRRTFERTIDVISKIPSIDTDTAREEIRRRLLAEPRDYIRSCREVLETAGIPVKVEKIVDFGHRLSDYGRLIEEHEVDLLVFNTKDEDQLAMHGLTYPLAVEFRQIPLLML